MNTQRTGCWAQVSKRAAGGGGLGQLDQLPQRLGGLGVQRDHAFGVGLADRDPQPWVAVRVGVQAVDGEPADFALAGAAPAHQQQRGALVGILQALDGLHQPVQFVPRNEPRQPGRQLRQVGTAEQRAGGHVVPAPLAGLPEEDQQRADVAVTGPGRQGPSVTRVDAVVQVSEVGLDVVAVQSGQAGDLGVVAGQPGQQVAEGVPGAAHRLGPVGGLQPARQPPVDRRGDRGWGAGRHRLLFPDHVAAQSVHRLAGNLAGVEQQHVQGVQPAPALLGGLPVS